MTALLFRSVGRITLGKRTPSRGKRYGATSRIRRYHVEITHMDWPRAVLHTGVSEVDPARLGWDSYTAERQRVLPGKTRAQHGGGAVLWKNTRIHVGSPKGNHYTRAPSPAQGLTLGNVRVLDLASGAPPHLTAEDAGGTSTGFAVRNWTEKQQGARIRSIEGNGAASVIDTERVPVLLAIRDTGGHWLYTEIVKPRKRIRCRPAGSFTNVCYWGASRQSPRGSCASRRVCSHTKGAR